MSAPPTNRLPAHDVDQVVDAVLRRLRSESGSGPANQQAATNGASSLRVGARVVTLESLPRSLAGISQLVAPAGAILTPAARDRLVEARIRVTYESHPAPSARQPGELPLALALAWNAAPLVADLARRGVASGLTPHTSDAEAVAALLPAIGIHGRGVLLTDEPQIGCCLANRDPRIRAAMAGTLPELDRLLTKLGVNLLAVRPLGQSTPMLARLIERFATAAPHA